MLDRDRAKVHASILRLCRERPRQETGYEASFETVALPKGTRMKRVSPAKEPQNLTPRPALKNHCDHRRLVEAVLNGEGTATGQLLCMECKGLFPDPLHQKPRS